MPHSETTTRVVQPAGADDAELAERVALFALVHRHPRASKVLEGFATEAREAAMKLFATATAWPSSKRQARAALEFGPLGDRHERLAGLVAEASPALRLALCAHMSPTDQARFPQLVGKPYRQLPGRDAFAARLVREATR